MAMTPALRESLRHAELVFRGKVAGLRASTMPEVPASDATVVIAVAEVYRSPEALRGLAGTSITVVTRDPQSLQQGQDILFLARGWLYGQSIAVLEVARESGGVDFKGLPQQIDAEDRMMRDEALGERIANASVIVVGRVVETRLVGIPDPLTVSEHTPMWTEATVHVTGVEKGSLTASEVTIMYPESRDILWYQAPKFQIGQEGVWILQRQPLEGLDREGLTALHPLDFHARDAVERIRGLLRAKP
jgi:hypothetical protein